MLSGTALGWLGVLQCYGVHGDLMFTGEKGFFKLKGYLFRFCIYLNRVVHALGSRSSLYNSRVQYHNGNLSCQIKAAISRAVVLCMGKVG